MPAGLQGKLVYKPSQRSRLTDIQAGPATIVAILRVKAFMVDWGNCQYQIKLENRSWKDISW